MYSTKEVIKSERITFRLTADNREALQTTADNLGMSVSELIEARLFDATDSDNEPSDDLQNELDEALDLLKQWQTYAKSVEAERNEAQQNSKALQSKVAGFERQNAQAAQKIAVYESVLQPLYVQVQQTGLYDAKGKRIEIQSPVALLQYIISNLQIQS